MTSFPVISGIGYVGPSGCGLQELESDLAKGALRLSEVDRSGGYHRTKCSNYALQITDLDLKQWVPARLARRMSPPSRWCLAAAKMALEQAQWPSGEPLGDRTGTIVGTAFGTTSFTEGLLKEILFDGPQQASPFYFAETVANAPTAQIAIGTKATGTNETVTQREVGDLVALGRAAAEIVRGRCDRVLTGVYDEIHPLIHAYLDRYQALSDSGGRGSAAPIPFDLRRSGFVTGEGATIVLLEDEEASRGRGVTPRIRIRGAGEAFDPSAQGHGWGQGADVLSIGLHRVLKRCGVAPADLDLIVSGASGSIDGDRIEAGILTSLGDNLPPVVTPRSLTGVFGGGFLAAALSIAAGASLGSTGADFQIDPSLGIQPVSERPANPPGLTLVSTPAAGGAAAWLILERV